MLQDVIQPPTPDEQQQQLPIEEISSPISGRFFELCDPGFLSDTLQNSEVTSSSNCCHEDKSSYATTISPPLDAVDNNKININSNSNIVTTTSSSITTDSTTTNNNNIINNNNNTTNSNNLSMFFDSQDEFDNDISASIDFSSSPSFAVPPLLPISTQQDHFDFSSAQHQLHLSASGSVLKSLSQYPSDPVVAPLIGAPLASVFDDDCISSIPSYVPLNTSSPSCSYLNPGIGAYMPPPGSLTSALSADSSGLFGGNILLGSELQAQELDYQGENCGIYCTDSIQRVFNPPELQALGNESQKLVSAGGSTTLAPEISHLEDSTLKVGKLSVEQRKEKIHRYMKKRNERNFSKKIKYACRKTLADSRPRVRGRFAKNDDFGDSHRQGSSNHEEDDEEIIVKEDDDLVDSSEIFAHISGVNSLKCNYSIQSLI